MERVAPKDLRLREKAVGRGEGRSSAVGLGEEVEVERKSPRVAEDRDAGAVDAILLGG